MITRIGDWPRHSNGAWVIGMIWRHLEGKGVVEVEDWFQSRFTRLGNQTPLEYVQTAVKSGKVQSYTDAWHDVFAVAQRIYGVK
jgi:hypothetical protein